MTDVSERIDRLSPLQRAVLAIKDLRARLDNLTQQRTEPIAIVGIGCRFPGGANDPRSFWRLLSAGEDAITEVPSSRWKLEDHWPRGS